MSCGRIRLGDKTPVGPEHTPQADADPELARVEPE